MRVTWALLLLGLRPSLLQDRPLEELLQQLTDDSIERRSQAAEALVEKGPAVVELLKKAQPRLPQEAQRRVDDILALIDKRERIKAVIGEPTLITLKADNLSVRRACEEVQNQSGTPIDSSRLPADLRVSLALFKVPFWEAIDRVCRASGRVMYDLAEDRVLLLHQNYREIPRRLVGAFLVFFSKTEIRPLNEPDERAGQWQLDVRAKVGWERKAQPAFLRAQTVGFRDDQGFTLEDLKAQEGGLLFLDFIGSDKIAMESREFATLPRKPVKLARYDLQVHVDFPLRWDRVTFERPERKSDVEASCDAFVAKLSRCTTSFGSLEVDLQLRSRRDRIGVLPHNPIWVHDKDGKVVCGTPAGSDGDTGERIYRLRCERFYEIGDKIELSELHVRVPTEVHTKKITVELRDLVLHEVAEEK